MLLPCPHCRRRFKVPTEQLPSARARIKCPACEGVFVLNLAASSEPAEGLRESDVPASASADARASLGMETATVRHALDRDRPRFLLFWTLVPACCLLLALAGILLSGPWLNTQAPGLSVSRVDTGTEAPLSSSVSSHPEVARHPQGPHGAPADQIPQSSLQLGNRIARAFWTLSSDPMAACKMLIRSQAELRETGNQDICQIYPLWITYLILETAPVPDCEVEPTFSMAAGALQREALCGPGHAFLCTYYLKRGLLDRSQSFLDQALRRAPDDPWVNLVEAVFYAQAYYDDERAISILAGLNRQHPSFSLVGYILGKAYIREERYREANAAFESLKEDAKGQIAFWRIRRALSSIEQTADQGEENAEAILALSRAFTTLQDDAMAQDLYSWFLEEMPARLSKRERMAAYCELGGIYERKGDNSSAYDSYRNALEIDPDFPAAREGIRGLSPDPSGPS